MLGIVRIGVFIGLLLATTDSGIANRMQNQDGETGWTLVKCGDTQRCIEDSSENTEYCVMPMRYFDILPGLRKADFDTGKEDEVVARLDCLYDGDPEKWINQVIIYSSEKKEGAMERDVFLGVAIYAQYYQIHRKWKDTLIDNLFELYIKRAILDNPEGFYNMIYQEGNKNPRDETECSLLESLMEEVLLKVIIILDIPFSINDRDLKMHVINDYCTAYDWCKRISSCLACVDNNGPDTFKNVVMEKPPMPKTCNANDDDNRIILLTLIGMIRSGKHTISAECRKWFGDENGFKRVIDLVNTNKNLTGVTGLSSVMNLEEIFGGIKEQLRYLEIEFGHGNIFNNEAMSFVKSLKSVEIKVTFCDHDALMIRELVDGTGDIRIKNLKMMSGAECLADQEIMKLIAESEKVENLEFDNTNESLEAFLLNHFKLVAGKMLKRLAVHDLGDLDNKEILATTPFDLKIERLDVKLKENNDSLFNVQRLIKIITRNKFKYIFFTNLSKEYTPKIVRTVEKLKWVNLEPLPAIIMNSRPLFGAEYVDYGKINEDLYIIFI